MQAREAVYRILVEIENGAYANIALDDFLRKNTLSQLDKAFVTEIVYGSVKYQLKLDWIIGQLVQKASKLEIGPKIILRMALYQLLFMERVPASAATNEAVKLANKLFHKGIAGLINGVLRTYLRNPGAIKWPDRALEPEKYLEIVYSHPAWMVKRWLERYGFEAAEKTCLFNNSPADLWIRTNTLRIDRESLCERLTTEGCSIERSVLIPEGIKLTEAPPLLKLPSFNEGLFTVQDESSMLPAYVLHPAPGHEVLDVCAGPGGKTTHLAQLMEDRGSITAMDVHEHRLKLIENTADRLGIKIIHTVLQDATKIDADAGHEEKYDCVLVDAPCSGLGVLRRRPDSRWRKKPEDITELSKLQEAILRKAIRTLKPGGRLVYSTCTTEPEENADVINELLKTEPQVKTFNLAPYLPCKTLKPDEQEELVKGRKQYLPFKDGIEGFFIAGLEKIAR